MTNNNAKPSYSMSLKGIGSLGLFLFLFGMAVSIIMYFQYDSDITIWFTLQAMFIMGAYAGRIFEGNYHKRVMSHMTTEYQNLYRKMARCLHDHDKDAGDIEVVKCSVCGVDTMVSKFDEHLCQQCIEEKEKEEMNIE